MAFMLEDQDISITSESAPLIEPMGYDNDVELFQVPLKRVALPLAIPDEEPVSQAALRYALATSPPAISEETASSATRRNSSPDRSSEEDSEGRRGGSTPPSSVDTAGDKNQKLEEEKTKENFRKIYQATQQEVKNSKTRTIHTKRPRRLVLPLKLHDPYTENEEDWSHIYRWLDQCHQYTPRRERLLAGSHLLHPFLGPALFSPLMPTLTTDHKNPTDKSPINTPNNDEGLLQKQIPQQASQQPPQQTKPTPSTNTAPTGTATQPSPPARNPNRPGKLTPTLHPPRHPSNPLPPQPSPTRLSSKHATPDSAYDRAREMEILISETDHLLYNTRVKGKDHWVIDCDLTESSHFRLAAVARMSAEGFDLPLLLGAGRVTGGGGTGQKGGGRKSGGVVVGLSEEEYIQLQVQRETAAELTNLYRVLAVVHMVYGEEMRREREVREIEALGMGTVGKMVRRRSGRERINGRRGVGGGSLA